MKIIFTLFLAALSYTVSAQNVNIPDAAFKALLVANTSINTNGDTEIQVSEAAAATTIEIYSAFNITDLTGLSAFTNLSVLILEGPQVSSINLSNHPNLTRLLLWEMPISAIDLSVLPNLNGLNLNRIHVPVINLSNNTNLTEINIVENNTLTALDLSPISNLTTLNLGSFPLLSFSNVNFGNTPNTLEVFYLGNGTELSFDFTPFTQLNSVGFTRTKFTNINFTQNPLLTRISASYNDSLTTLNIANGNNANITVMSASNCPNLTCIYVDSAIVGTTPAGWSKDSTATYCYDTTTVVGVSREFSSANEARFYPNPAANYLSIENAQIGSTLWISDVLGRVVLRQELNSENSEIATSQLQNGIYFIQFELNGLRTRAEKVLISK